MDRQLMSDLMLQTPLSYCSFSLEQDTALDDAVLQDINPAFETLFSLNREECLGLPLHDLPSQCSCLLEALSYYKTEALLSADYASSSYLAYTEEESRYYQFYPLLIEDSTIMLLIHDSSGEQRHTKALEEEVAALTRTKMEKLGSRNLFLSGINRELKGPLHGITGFLQLLEMEPDTKNHKKIIENLHWSVQQLSQLFQDMTDYIDLIEETVDYDLIPFNLHSLLTETIKPFLSAASDKQIKLSIRMIPNVQKYAVGDMHRIRQVLQILIARALAHTQAGSILLIASKHRGAFNTIVFTVKDTGSSLTSEQIGCLFLPFNQPYIQRSEKQTGNGLSLSIARLLTEQMGGQIHAASKAGLGTTITLTIPLENPDYLTEKQEANFTIFKDKKILLVDSQKMHRAILEIYLAEEHCTYEEAYNAADAITKVTRSCQEPYDLLLIDDSLPDMKAADLLSVLSLLDTSGSMPIILLHSEDSTERPADIRNLYMIEKPYERSFLINTMANALAEIRPGYSSFEDTSSEESLQPDKPIRILICDKESMDRIFLTTLLQIKHIAYDIAEDSTTILQAFRTTPYDLVFLNCTSVYPNGTQTVAELRAQETDGRHTPIIAMMDQPSKYDIEQCQMSGIDNFIRKPIDMTILTTLIEEYTTWFDPASANQSVYLKPELYLPGGKKNTITDKPHILIVDDETTVTKLLESALQDEYKVSEAHSGMEALQLAMHEPVPDLILLDISMPDIDGVEICMKLKEMPITRDVPVILITSYEEEKNEARAFQHGAVDYILKPFSFPIVKNRIKSHIAQKRSRDFHKMSSFMDELTKVPNRRNFNEVLTTEWGRAKRSGRFLSLLLFDIDMFKRYNDNYGYIQGNQCLYTIAQLIRHELKRPTDLFARLNDDRFACLLPDTDQSGAILVAEKLRHLIETAALPFEQSPLNQVVTISVGVATIVPNAESRQDDLLVRADAALYKAKELGHNRVHAG